MARAIYFAVIIALVAIYSRETFAKTTVNPLSDDHEIVQHTGQTNAGTATVDSSTTGLEIVKHTWPDRLRACIKTFSDATCSFLRFPKGITGVRFRPLYILGTLAMAAMHAHIGGVGALTVSCSGPNDQRLNFHFPDLDQINWPNEEYIYTSQNTGGCCSIKRCTETIGLKCIFNEGETPLCGLQFQCKDGYVRNDDSVCVPIDSPEGRALESQQPDKLEDL